MFTGDPATQQRQLLFLRNPWPTGTDTWLKKNQTKMWAVIQWQHVWEAGGEQASSCTQTWDSKGQEDGKDGWLTR